MGTYNFVYETEDNMFYFYTFTKTEAARSATANKLEMSGVKFYNAKIDALLSPQQPVNADIAIPLLVAGFQETVKVTTDSGTAMEYVTLIHLCE